MSEISHQTYTWPSGAIDRELTAAMYVLSALDDRVDGYVEVHNRSIDFGGLLALPWSGGERAMLEMACSLWGRQEIADGRLSDLLHSIDRASFERVLEAIQMRRGDV